MLDGQAFLPSGATRTTTSPVGPGGRGVSGAGRHAVRDRGARARRRRARSACCCGEPDLLGQLMAGQPTWYDAMGLGHPAATPVVEEALARPACSGRVPVGEAAVAPSSSCPEHGALDGVDGLIR